MKVHQQQFTRALWDHHPHHNPSDHHETTTLSLSCKRLRPLAPKLPGHVDVVSSFSSSPTTTAAFDLKSFIRPDSGPRKLAPPPPPDFKKDSLQVETHPGGTRWNPTQEQIGILEAMYCRGMRTPNAQQIEQITAQLSKYGKIEGKNVFYWFQNHKARERQKQKRHSHSVLGLPSQSPKTTPFLTANTNTAFIDTTPVTLSFDSPKEEPRREEQMTPSKRKYRSWTFESFIEESTRTRLDKLADHLEEEDGVKKITLELFPLHPEAR